MRTLLMLAALGWSLPSFAQIGGCEGWLTYQFWHNAGVEDVTRCLDAGADVGARDKAGVTPLHWAAGRGDADTVPLLIAAGADVNVRDQDGETPLHEAAALGAIVGDADTVSLLIAAGADVNVRDQDGVTPLHQAALVGSAEAASLLLGAGADVGARANDGSTSLQWAANWGYEEVARLLIVGGATEVPDWLYELAGFTGEEKREHREAERQRFQLYNDCKPMDYGVSLDLSDGESVQGLTEKAISDAVESRLRAARLYDSEEPSYFFVYIHLLDSQVGGRHTGWAYNMDVSFNKRVRDEASGTRRWASTWERGSIGTAPDSGTGEAILGSVRGYMDEFLAEYLRVNEKACE